MPSSSASAPVRVARFGVFEADLQVGELRKHGLRIKLQEQPFQVLAMLLERQGQLVTREEIHQKLWPTNTFVDFDHGLNNAINRLREALGDSAESPQFIETLPRKGYRFIAMVEFSTPEIVVNSVPRGAISAHELPPEAVKKLLPEEPSSRADIGMPRPPSEALAPPASSARAPTGRRWKIFVPAIGLLALATAGVLLRVRRSPALTDKDTVAIADFVNTTGDIVFDDALKEALAVQLEQSPFLNVLSDRKIQQTLRLMGRSPNEPLTQDVAREVCERAGSKAILAGSISSLGTGYVIGLKAVNCATGDLLGEEQARARDKEEVLKALDRGAASIRRKLGESLSSIRKFDIPIAQMTTPSLEALKAYSLATKASREKGHPADVPYYKRAIEIDPNFAMAYASLGMSYASFGENNLVKENITKAYQFRDRVSERENYAISAYYYELVTGEIEKAVQSYTLWAQLYPRDFTPHANLWTQYSTLGRYTEAISEDRKAIELEPNSVITYAGLGETYLNLNRLDEAKTTFEQSLARKLDGGFLREEMYYLAFFQGDAWSMQQQVAWATGKPGDEDLLLSIQSDTEAYYGRLASARDFSRRAVESANRADLKEDAAGWAASQALREAEVGNAKLARRLVAAALALASGRDVNVLSALALARSGDESRAQELAQELETQYPLNTILKYYWLPTIRAAIELNRGDASRAVRLLGAATPYELGNPPPIGALYPCYIRGLAYLRLQRGIDAAAEFQKLPDRRGIVGNFVLGALAHIGLARAYALKGEAAKARAAYQDFFALWKDADPDIPILKQARSEYAKLR